VSTHVKHAHRHVPGPVVAFTRPERKNTVRRMKYHIWNIFCGKNFYDNGKICKENELAKHN
jgi:hypothetical protein